jgi:hypothetical protein
MGAEEYCGAYLECLLGFLRSRAVLAATTCRPKTAKMVLRLNTTCLNQLFIVNENTAIFSLH